MTYTKQKPLSEYQTAVLTQMGITPWQLTDPVRIEHEASGLEQKNLQKELEAEAPVEEKATTDKGMAEVVQVTQSDSTDPSPVAEPVYHSVPDTILSGLDKERVPHRLLTDILMAMGLEDKAMKWIPAGELHQYRDYVLVWKTGQDFSLIDRRLTIPGIESLSTADGKRQLWRVISKAGQQDHEH